MTDKNKTQSIFHDYSEKIRQRVESAEQAKRDGKNTFQQLEARLTDVDSGKLVEDIVIYAIRIIEDTNRAKDFLTGYIADIETNPCRYRANAKKNPTSYAKSDIVQVLSLHFASKKTHKLWNRVVDNYSASSK